MDRQKRGRTVQGGDSLESTDQGTPCSLQEEVETDKSEKIILSEEVGLEVTAVQLVCVEGETEASYAEVETVCETENSLYITGTKVTTKRRIKPIKHTHNAPSAYSRPPGSQQ